MPQTLVDWLTRLGLLEGVPFNYLVPDEAMLPPESLRFFYLDPNWTSALLDGAMSIGAVVMFLVIVVRVLAAHSSRGQPKKPNGTVTSARRLRRSISA